MRKIQRDMNCVINRVEPTPFMTLSDPNFQPIPAGREVNINTVPNVESSIEEGYDSSPSGLSPTRSKRFLYLLTTTITTFQVISSTYTTSLKPGDGLLECRPGGIPVC